MLDFLYYRCRTSFSKTSPFSHIRMFVSKQYGLWEILQVMILRVEIMSCSLRVVKTLLSFISPSILIAFF